MDSMGVESVTDVVRRGRIYVVWTVGALRCG